MLKRILNILCTIFIMLKISAQSNPVFQHLTTSNGLSYIGVNNMCSDKKGNLWIATGNGLNMFNGRTVEKYFVAEYPAMMNNNIIQVNCDSSDRVWILTAGGYVSMLDKKRQMHQVAIYDQKEWVKTNWILRSAEYGIILYTAKGNYILKENNLEELKDSLTQKNFDLLPIKGFHELNLKGRSRVFAYDDQYYLLIYGDSFLKVKYSNNTVDKKYNVPGLTALIKWRDNELLVYDNIGKEVKAIHLETEKITFPFKGMTDQHGSPVTGTFNSAAVLNNNRFLFTTTEKGLYIFHETTGKIYNYRHHFADPSSVGTDQLSTVHAGHKGWVFVNSFPSGISYFNANDFVGNQKIFTDRHGNGYDGIIHGIATTDHNIYYLGIADGLIEWKRDNNSSVFIKIKDKAGQSFFGEREVESITIDHTGNIWAAAFDRIIVLNKNRQLVRLIKHDTIGKKSFKMTRISRVSIGPDGYVWACGRLGMCRINPISFEVDNFENTPLQYFDTIPVVPLYFSDKNNLWIATSFSGLYHYNMITKELKEFTAFRPFARDGLLDFKVESNGTIYTGNYSGFRIFFPDGRMKTFTQKNGLLIDRAEAILSDDHGRIWIGNDIGLACYNPADSSMRTFDVRYGLSIYGYWVGSYFRTANGEFVFGTPKGIQYFHPDSLYNKKIDLDVSVTGIETKSLTSFVSGNQSFRLPAGDNHVSFYFGSVDFSPHLQTFYQYKLAELDKDWINLTDQNSVRYNSLPPGKYIFKVRISNDNKTWQDAGNEVAVTVAVPFYQSWWFRTLAVLFSSLLIWYVIKYYQRKQQKQQEELETELVINYFASQINSRYKTDELLWDVARNLIGKLGFEDCMIYLWNDDKNLLVQKAGYGSKGSMETAMDRIVYHIPAGKGIVGAAVESKQSVLINDTSKDKRYFTVDGKIMLSELCVPLIHDNEVLGAINIEHQQKNFFTPKHLKMLSTIAVLCANQIQRIRAEEEKQQARIEALQNKQKAAETRLQSLRLQMNPHFLFNALNSIQQMILANEEMVATRYLSKFSKLLRTILLQSDKEFVTLKEELEILQLYIELESIRFKESFSYKLECDEGIDTDEIKLPTLLIQPFVENAIWHGLMHKEGDRSLQVKFFEKGDLLHCIVEDNGIGRERSRQTEQNMNQGRKHTSKGIQVSLERLKVMNNGNGKEGSLEIFDLKDEQGNATGTRVEIIFPIQNN